MPAEGGAGSQVEPDRVAQPTAGPAGPGQRQGNRRGHHTTATAARLVWRRARQDPEIERQRPNVAARSPAEAAYSSAAANCSPQTTIALLVALQHLLAGTASSRRPPVAQGEHHPTGGQAGEHEPGHQERTAGPSGLGRDTRS